MNQYMSQDLAIERMIQSIEDNVVLEKKGLALSILDRISIVDLSKILSRLAIQNPKEDRQPILISKTS